MLRDPRECDTLPAAQAAGKVVATEFERVRRALEHYVRADCHDRLKSCELESVDARPYSAVAYLTLRTEKMQKRLVAKTVAHHPVNRHFFGERNPAVVEYDILSRLHTGLETVEGCFVPRPLVVIPEMETYVMECVEGDIFANRWKHMRYLARRANFRSLKHYFFLCGRWLKHFQRITGSRATNATALAKTIEGCEHQLKLIEKAGGGLCPAHFRDRVMNDLQERASRLGEGAVLVSGRHGDFGPWNMIVHGRGLTVIDFPGYDEDPLVLDILKMLVCLDCERHSLTSSARRVAALRRSFLNGYGRWPAVPEPVLQICETRQRLSSLANCLQFIPQRLHHRVDYRRVAKAQLEWLTNGNSRRLLWPGL